MTEMLAAHYARTGPAAEVLEVSRLPVPQPGSGEVLVRVSDRKLSGSECGDIVVATNPTGGVVRLRDIANIRDDLAGR